MNQKITGQYFQWSFKNISLFLHYLVWIHYLINQKNSYTKTLKWKRNLLLKHIVLKRWKKFKRDLFSVNIWSKKCFWNSEHERVPYLKFSWSVFSRIWNECGYLLCKFTVWICVLSQNTRKYKAEKTLNSDCFHVVIAIKENFKQSTWNDKL